MRGAFFKKKIMKRNVILLLLIAVLSMFLSSCGKEKLDPSVPDNLYGEWEGENENYYFYLFLEKNADKNCIISGVSNRYYITEIKDAWSMPYGTFSYQDGKIICTGDLERTYGVTGQTITEYDCQITFDYHDSYLTGGIEPSIQRYEKK